MNDDYIVYIHPSNQNIFIPVFFVLVWFGLLFGSFFRFFNHHPYIQKQEKTKKSIQLEMIIIRLCSGLLFGLFGCCCSGWFICLFVWNFGRHCLTIPLHTYSTRYTHRISLSFSCFEFHSIQFCVWIILLSQCFSIR